MMMMMMIFIIIIIIMMMMMLQVLRMFQVDMCFICEQPSLDVSIAILWPGGLGLFNRDDPKFVIVHPCDRLIPGLHRNARSSVVRLHTHLPGGFKYFSFSSLPGEMIQFDEHIFQMG